MMMTNPARLILAVGRFERGGGWTVARFGMDAVSRQVRGVSTGFKRNLFRVA
jgi:hypothetical protein